jgi:hypothetical protein
MVPSSSGWTCMCPRASVPKSRPILGGQECECATDFCTPHTKEGGGCAWPGKSAWLSPLGDGRHAARRGKRNWRMRVLAGTVFVTRRRPANFSSSLFPPSSPRTFPRDWTLPTSAPAPWGEGARGGDDAPCIAPRDLCSNYMRILILLKISVWFVTDITEFSGIHNTLDLT